jgi:hypothetical protein
VRHCVAGKLDTLSKVARGAYRWWGDLHGGVTYMVGVASDQVWCWCKQLHGEEDRGPPIGTVARCGIESVLSNPLGSQLIWPLAHTRIQLGHDGGRTHLSGGTVATQVGQ